MKRCQEKRVRRTKGHDDEENDEGVGDGDDGRDERVDDAPQRLGSAEDAEDAHCPGDFGRDGGPAGHCHEGEDDYGEVENLPPRGEEWPPPVGVEADAQLDHEDGGQDIVDQISVQRELSVVDPVAVLVQDGPVLGQQARQHKGLPAHSRVSFSADLAADAR